MGSSCGAVSIAVASDSRDPQFESSHGQVLFTINCEKNCIEKDDNKVFPLQQQKSTDVGVGIW